MSILENLIKMPGFLPVLGTLGGALITGLIAYGMNRTNKQSEERKHQRELIFKTAFVSWKQHTDIAIEKNESRAFYKNNAARFTYYKFDGLF